MVRDVGLAEELAQDALVAALETWPASGVPQNPGAWLMATAKRRAIDVLRRGKRLERKTEEALVRTLSACGLQTECPYPVDELLPIMLRDKKRAGGRITLVLLRALGDAMPYTLDLPAFEELARRCAR